MSMNKLLSLYIRKQKIKYNRVHVTGPTSELGQQSEVENVEDEAVGTLLSATATVSTWYYFYIHSS